MISDTNVLPLRLNIDFDDFVRIYLAAAKHNDEASKIRLIEIMKYSFQDWAYAWNSKDYVSNINISSLLNLLKADNKPTAPLQWKIDTYNKYLEVSGFTFMDELVFCLLKHINKDHFYRKKYNHKKKFLFFISRDIKMFLFKHIRSILARAKRSNEYLIPVNTQFYYYDEIIDYYCLEENLLYKNFLLLFSQKLTKEEIKELLFLSDKKYQECVKWLSQNLKLLNK